MTENKLKFLVVGAGSIGTRHIKNLLKLGVNVKVVRYRRELRNEIKKIESSIKIFDSIENALEDKIDAVIISNRTDQHIDTAIKIAKNGINIFIEKPLSNSLLGLDELSGLVNNKRLVVDVGFMMRFHPNLANIRKMLSDGIIGRPYFARAVVGQYLPDWRPGTNYKTCYSASREKGGGVILDLIHELDLMLWWFGEVREVSAMIAYTPELEITSESIAQIQLGFTSGVIAQVHMDYLRPLYQRSVEIVGSSGQLTWEYLSGKVHLIKYGAEPKLIDNIPDGFERNTMFLDNMKHFISRLNNKTQGVSASLDDGIKVQRVALAAFKSYFEKKFVCPADIEFDFNITRF